MKTNKLSSDATPQQYLQYSYSLFSQQAYEQAIQCLYQGIKLHPSKAELLFQLGFFFQFLQQHSRAQELYHKVLKLRPNEDKTHFHLGLSYWNDGKTLLAYHSFKQAIKLNPRAQYYYNLAQLMAQESKPSDVCNIYLDGLAKWPEDRPLLQGLFEYLRGMDLASLDWETLLNHGLEKSLLKAYEWRCTEDLILARVSQQVLLKQPIIQAFMQMTLKEQIFVGPFLRELGEMPLFQYYLSQNYNIDWELESALIVLRRFFLKEINQLELLQQATLLLNSLIKQCWNNEYVWRENEAETQLLEQLDREFEDWNESECSISQEYKLGIYALYRSVDKFSRFHTHSFQELTSLNEVIENYCQWVEFKSQIPRKTTIHDSSQEVQEQYEVHPYPRWFFLPERNSPLIKDALQELLPGGGVDDWEEPDELLVAGCGTGRHALMMAYQFSHLKVFAFDLSSASLAYALQQKQRLNLDNIQFEQADVLQFAEQKKQYSLIECSGVLHHLKDPLEGWGILKNCLTPGGLMKVSLYSQIARRDIYELQAEFSQAEASLKTIQQARVKLKNRQHRCCFYYDFFTTSGCRDFLFHVRDEVPFNALKIKLALSQLKLEFLGFEMTSQVKQLYQNTFPEDLRMTNLDNWHLLEQKHSWIFIGMYQIWCKKPR